MLLADVPAGQRVAQHLRAAHERREARYPEGIAARREYLFGVDRLQVDALIGVRDHLLLERGALQVGFDGLAPGRVVDPWEIIPKRKFFRDHV